MVKPASNSTNSKAKLRSHLVTTLSILTFCHAAACRGMSPNGNASNRPMGESTTMFRSHLNL